MNTKLLRRFRHKYLLTRYDNQHVIYGGLLVMDLFTRTKPCITRMLFWDFKWIALIKYSYRNRPRPIEC